MTWVLIYGSTIMFCKHRQIEELEETTRQRSARKAQLECFSKYEDRRYPVQSLKNMENQIKEEYNVNPSR